MIFTEVHSYLYSVLSLELGLVQIRLLKLPLPHCHDTAEADQSLTQQVPVVLVVTGRQRAKHGHLLLV